MTVHCACDLNELRAESPQLPDGSFLFTSYPVGIIARQILFWTGYPETHVAVLFYDPVTSEPWVYEAYPPRSLKLPLKEHLDRLDKQESRWRVVLKGGANPVWISPNWPQSELVLMRAKAEELLGIPYRLALNYFFGNDRAMHCSEYAGAVVNVTGRINYERHRETPGGLMRKLKVISNELESKI